MSIPTRTALLRGDARRAAARAAALGIAVVLAATSAACRHSSDTAVEPLVMQRPFADSSPWNVPIPAAAVLAKDSAKIARELAETPGIRGAGLYEYAVPIYYADADSPWATVRCTENWGECPFDDPVRIPTDARAASGSDGAMVVIDRGTGTAYEFWRARRVSETEWTTSWGAVVDDAVTGDGSVREHATGSSVSRLGGLVTVQDIEHRKIAHALTLASSLACAGKFKFPARKTDGDSTADGCIPEGSRIRLDPAVDLAAIADISEGEKLIGRALQQYGGYVIDKSRAPLAVTFELPADASSDNEVAKVYRDVGFDDDPYLLDRIPWDRIQVLAAWDGSADRWAPTEPTHVTASVEDGDVSLSWTAAGDEVGVAEYRIWRRIGSGKWQMVGTRDADELDFVDEDPSTGEHFYEVRAVDHEGNISNPSTTVVLRVAPPK